MFEAMTYENILQNMLDEVSPLMDKRPGSVIYDALAPCAARLAQFYISLDLGIDIGFIDTTFGDYLKRKGSTENAVFLKEALPAERIAIFTGTIPSVGSRFLGGNLYWYLSSNGHILCEIAGEDGNIPLAGTQLIPTDDISGLTSATMGDIVVPGSNDEDTEDYRQRVIDKINNPPTSSNMAMIKKWCLEIEGIGDAQIYPLWQGVNTVQAVLLNNLRKAPTAELVARVQEYIDPIAHHGLGEGQADIGVVFTATAATNTNISIKVTIDLAPDKLLADAQAEITSGIESYLQSISFKETQVKYGQIGAIILNALCVTDYSNLLVNNQTSNVNIPTKCVPNLVTVEVVEPV